jgi:hypothetical protein
MSWLILALACGANAHLDEARRLIQAMDYAAAEAQLKVAKTQVQTVAERRELYALLARALAALGRPAELEAMFLEQLAADPHAPDPEAAPRVRDAFTRAKERLYPGGYVKLVESSGEAGVRLVRLVDPWRRVHHLTVSSAGPEGPFTSREVSPGDADPLRLGGRETRVYVEAHGKSGMLANLGTAAAPLLLAQPAAVAAPPQAIVPQVTEQPGAVRPHKWVALGLAVGALAAAGVGTGFGAASSSSARQAGLATHAFTVTQLDDAAAAQARAANSLFIGAGVLAGGAAVAFFWPW